MSIVFSYWILKENKNVTDTFLKDFLKRSVLLYRTFTIYPSVLHILLGVSKMKNTTVINNVTKKSIHNRLSSNWKDKIFILNFSTHHISVVP